MLQRIARFLTKAKIKFYHWKFTRKIKDNALVQVPIPDLEDDVYLITLPGNLAKVFSWVETNLMFDPNWEEDHLRAFYQSVLDLIVEDELDETLLLMHLHPESYISVEDDEDVEFRPE